ncbi:MAG: superoxide dismutase family protein [Rhodothermaceae bacterium]|nr:superoxide dismutase family protein [Rhodothermaceae bacterium]
MLARLTLGCVLAGSLLLSACAEDTSVDPPPAPEAEPIEEEAPEEAPEASALIRPLDDSGVEGLITFQTTNGGVQVTYALAGLTPGAHGFHVHENGDCDPGDDGTPGGAAGGHFAPQEDPHGAPSAEAGQRHVGDFGNIEAGADGRASGTFVDALIAFEGDNSIIDRAVVVHAEADDLESQPSGNAGARVGCGVVRSMASMQQNLPPGHPPIN